MLSPKKDYRKEVAARGLFRTPSKIFYEAFLGKHLSLKVVFHNFHKNLRH